MCNHLKNNNNPSFQTVLLNSGDIKIKAEENYRDTARALNRTSLGEWSTLLKPNQKFWHPISTTSPRTVTTSVVDYGKKKSFESLLPI
jgi:hypothetical protein